MFNHPAAMAEVLAILIAAKWWIWHEDIGRAIITNRDLYAREAHVLLDYRCRHQEIINDVHRATDTTVAQHRVKWYQTNWCFSIAFTIKIPSEDWYKAHRTTSSDSDAGSDDPITC